MKPILGIKRVFFFLFIHILLFQFGSKAQVTLFSESWASNNFTANGWTFSPNQLQNWKDSSAYVPVGATAPCALFYWAPLVNTSYTNSLVSPIIQSISYNTLTLSCKIHYEQWPTITTPTQEELMVQYKAVGANNWTTLKTYDNNNSTSASYDSVIINAALVGVTGNVQIRFRVNGDNTHNIQGWTIDDIVVKGVLLSACSGAPTVSIAANTYNYCTNATNNPVLTATPGSANSGYTFQWQSRPACTNTAFADISGATTANYVVSSLAAATDYRVKITCTGSNQSAWSNVVNIYPACYCQSAAQNTTGADIGYVYFNGSAGIFNNPATSPSPLVNNSSANRDYTDFSSIAPIQFTSGTNPLYYVTQINSTATQTPAFLKIFVDFNKNGSFNDIGEQINTGSSSTGTPTPTTFSGTLTIPASALPGYTKMRLVLVENGSALTVNSCSNNYLQGETEDYTVLIKPATTQTLTATNSGPICLSSTASLQLFANISTGMGCPVFSWTGPNGFTSSIQNPVISSPTAANIGIYNVVVTTYGNNYSLSASTTVSTGTAPVISSSSAQNPTTCTNNNGNITLNGLTANTSYTVTYLLNGTPVSTTITSNPSGSVIITNLGAGVYTVITAAIGGCSAPPVGPFILTAQFTSTLTAGNTGPYCAGSTISLTASSITNATYSWTGPNSFTSNVQNPTITNATTSYAGTYSVMATVNGCTSLPATTTVTVNPQPVFTVSNTTNPSACGSSNGSFTLSGLTANTSYTITYQKNGTPQTVTVLSTATGTVTVSSLGAGTYSNIVASTATCQSAPYSSVILTAPPPPTTPSINSNSPLCAGSTLNLSTPTVAGATYQWAGPNSFTSNLQNPSVVNMQLANAGNYTLTITIGSCSSPQAFTPVIVTALPSSPSVSATNSTICAGTPLNLFASSSLSGVTFSWTGPSGFTSSLQNPVIANTTSSNSGTYYATVTNNGCTSLPTPLPITVNALPFISSVSVQNPTGCGLNNGSFTVQGLLPNTQYIITYARNSVAQIPDTAYTNSLGQITVHNLYAGFYNAIIAILNGCPSLAFTPGVNLVDPAGPAQPTINVNTPICVGSTVFLSTPFVNNATYSWNGPGGFTSTSQNPVIPSAQISNSGNYTLTITVSNCTSTPATTTLTINPIPAAPAISSNSPVCVGGQISLTASSITNAVYHWSGPNSFTSTIQNPLINSATTAMSGKYYIYASIGGCLSSLDSIVVMVNPTPSKPTVTNDTFCQYAITVPLTATGQNLLWYNSPTSTTGSATAPTPSSNIAGATTWYVTQTVTGCESAKQSITVLIKPTPNAPGVVTPVLYCQYNTATPLTATGINLLWYTAATGGTGSPIAPLPNTNVLGTTTFFVSQTLNGCESNRSAIAYTVLSKPDTPLVNNPFLFCVGQTNASVSAQGIQLKWYNSPTSTNSSPYPPVINTSVAGTTVYYVTQTLGNNCESDRARVVVTVHENVKANISISKQLICQYDTILISNIANNPPNPPTAIYNWNFDGGVVISGTGQGPYQIRWDTFGHKTVKVSINNFNCADNAQDTVFVKESPLGLFAMKKDACIDEIMYVQAAWNSMDAADYYWDFTDAQLLNAATGPGAYKIKFTTPGYHYVVLKTHLNGCYSWPSRDTILIHDYPYAKIEPFNTQVCIGDTIPLKMSGITYPNYAYLWSPSNFFEINGLPTTTAFVRQSSYIKLSVVDQFGCVGSDSVMVNADVCCSVALPTAFTPNGDNKNDLFHIISNGNQQIAIFRVVNRWGQLLWETANSKEGWDGTTNGVAQDMGTYYYFLRYKCRPEDTEFHEMKGEIILIR